MPNKTHVIFGTGPVGCWIARSLREKEIPVRAVNRSGRRPALLPNDVEIVGIDATDTEEAIAAAKDAETIYQALSPPYHLWEKYFPALQESVMAAAKKVEARYISIENLYLYDPIEVISEDSPVRPRARKGILRAKMAEEVISAHQRGDLQTAALRSSDYYGPGVTHSVMGERVFGRLVANKAAQLIGAADIPHSWAYIEDVGKAAATLGSRKDACGKVWIAPHAPPCTQQEMVETVCRILGKHAKMTTISPLMMKTVGLFSALARASAEMTYQFTEPFIVDSTRFQEEFSITATPLEEGIAKTIAWYEKFKGTF